jgi:hypothetical protein
MTQYPQPRQQPQANPAWTQPQIEQKRNATPNSGMHSSRQYESRTPTNPTSQRGYSGSERSASESRGSRRAVN